MSNTLINSNSSLPNVSHSSLYGLKTIILTLRLSFKEIYAGNKSYSFVVVLSGALFGKRHAVFGVHTEKSEGLIGNVFSLWSEVNPVVLLIICKRCYNSSVNSLLLLQAAAVLFTFQKITITPSISAVSMAYGRKRAVFRCQIYQFFQIHSM